MKYLDYIHLPSIFKQIVSASNLNIITKFIITLCIIIFYVPFMRSYVSIFLCLAFLKSYMHIKFKKGITITNCNMCRNVFLITSNTHLEI
jgi:hypothetical protein